MCGGSGNEIRKYVQAALARHASFSPFVLSVDGLMACEARFVVQRFADKLFIKWRKPYCEVIGWVQTRLSFAILRATNRCVWVENKVEEWSWNGRWGRCGNYELVVLTTNNQMLLSCFVFYILLHA